MLVSPIFTKNRKAAGDPKNKIINNRGGTRCFAGETLVRTDSGYKQIRDIVPGDMVLSFNPETMSTEFKPVVNIFHTKAGHTNKKVITLVNNIRCSYDHKFLYHGRWQEIAGISWREISGSRRPLPNLNHGQIVHDQLQKNRPHSSNETSQETRIHEYGNNAQRKIQERCSSQVGSSGVHTEPSKQTPGQSHKPHSIRQPSGKPRVVYSPGKYRSHDGSWKADGESRNKERNGEANRGSSKGNTRKARAFCLHEEDAGGGVRSERSVHQGCAVSVLEAREITDDELQVIDISTGVDLYDIEVQDNHSYCITEENIIVHNSTKTYSIQQLAAIWLISGEIGKGRYIDEGIWTTVRRWGSTLDKTVIRDFEEILNNEGWYDLVHHNKTKRTYSCEGRLVEFIGADDQQKLKGSKRNILYCNEGDELNFKQEFHQLLIRTSDLVFIDFNPDDEDIWINTEIEQKRAQTKGDVVTIVSNYHDNPFLSDGQVDEIKYLEPVYDDEGNMISGDEEFWSVYGLGEYGKITGLIFDTKIVDKVPENAKYVGTGLDFGFTSSPTAIVDVYRHDMELYFDEVLYETGLTNQDIAERLKEIEKQEAKLKEKNKDLKTPERPREVICDSAEPKSIEELSRMGINAHPTDKGQDSVTNGIDILKRFKLHTTSRSLNIRKEDRKYKWSVDKNGKKVKNSRGRTIPAKAHDHGWDARRYVALIKLNESRGRYYLR